VIGGRGVLLAGAFLPARGGVAVAREYRPDRTGDLERRLAAVEAELDRHDRPTEDAEDESPGPVAGDG
jgi:hypothetical protein